MSKPNHITSQHFILLSKITLGGFLLAGFVAAILVLPFMLLWNMALVPALTIAKPIGFVHAFFLSIFFSFFIVGTNKNIRPE